MKKPFIEQDTSDFVEDKNFKKLVELYFGAGTKTTLRKEWIDYVSEDPVSKVLYIHVPELTPEDATNRLTKFWELMSEMKDYPMNLIIDVSFISQESYLGQEVNSK